MEVLETGKHVIETSAVLQRFDQQARLLKALAHPARLAILHVLRDGEHCVCHIEAHLGYRQAYISQQLMVLRDAGVIQDRRDGWNVYYRVSEPGIFALADAVFAITNPGEETVAIHPAAACPCPSCSGSNNNA